MPQLFLTGQSDVSSEQYLLLKDNLASMGSAVTQDQGSLAWCEALAIANCQVSALNFVRLLSNQLSPQTLSVYARRYAAIFGLNATGTNPIPDNLTYIKNTIALKEALFGTPNSLINVSQYIQAVIGQLFIDIEFNPDIQSLASGYIPLPPTDYWFSPLSLMYVRVWQPRDNQDHILVPNNIFLNIVDTYKNFVQEWLPSYAGIVNMQLQYPGNNGYGIFGGVNGYPTQLSGNAGDGYAQYGSTNTVFATAGNYYIQGNGGCNFIADMPGMVAGLYTMPIEIVDDAGVLQTYYANSGSLTNTNIITIVGTVFNNITNRSYRLLGVEMDTPYACDGGMLLNS